MGSSAGLGAWLLDSGIQLGTGAERGGVAGWLDERGQPSFVYPEVTGYYLIAMAFLGRCCDEPGAASRRAALALEWFERRLLPGEELPTRIYLEPQREHWSLQARFSFDLAMILRGLLACGSLGAELAGRTRPLAAMAAAHLEDFLDAGEGLLPCLPRAAERSLPRRWSTTPGPFQLKAAAGLLAAPGGIVSAALRAVARRVIERQSRQLAAQPPRGELHPYLYALEGLVLAGGSGVLDEGPAIAARLLGRVLEFQRSDGSLPAALEDRDGIVRTDGIAQALRLVCILRSIGGLRGAEIEARQRGLAGVLERSRHRGGGMPFRIDSGAPVHLNAVCALFAHQALHLHEHGADLPLQLLV